jgi:hypothetical protein
MYKLSMPIALRTINDETLPIYVEQARKCGANRIFVCGLGLIYSKCALLYKDPEKVKKAIEYFRAAGFEVGVWVGSLGNGHALATEGRLEENLNFTQITSIRGEAKPSLSNCPLDKNFVEAYKEGMRSVAGLGPDLIMIDDDFRLNIRIGVRFACFCPLHLKEFYSRIGEEIPRENLERILLTGGKNKYRTALLELFGETMINFAKELRSAIDEVNPKLRLGMCTHDTWDMSGTTPLEMAKALAGNTRPFARISGAPFRNQNIIPIVEYSRQQYAWAKDSGVELFSEGDLYPRPRTHIASRPFELFELLMQADGTSEGMLAYLFDYNSKPTYETGYVDRYCKNDQIRQSVLEIFKDKKPVGVEVFGVPHKAEEWKLPEELHPKAFEMLVEAVRPGSFDLLGANSIPSCFYEQEDYPLFIMGENARYVPLSRLKNGAILDASAAMILKERGVDTGIISASIDNFDREYFEKYDDSVPVFSPIANRNFFYRIECNDGVDVRSTFVPSNTPASYRYENSSGQRFYVLAFDHFISQVMGVLRSFVQSYYRQEELYDSVLWISGKKLPVYSAKNPYLYLLSSKSEDGSMSVAVANVNVDYAYDLTIKLDRSYSEIKCVGCETELRGDEVYISELSAYGFCAFEVKR